MKIIVVDNVLDSRALVAYVLKEAGATIITVESATEALQILSGKV